MRDVMGNKLRQRHFSCFVYAIVNFHFNEETESVLTDTLTNFPDVNPRP